MNLERTVRISGYGIHEKRAWLEKKSTARRSALLADVAKSAMARAPSPFRSEKRGTSAERPPRPPSDRSRSKSARGLEPVQIPVRSSTDTGVRRCHLPASLSIDLQAASIDDREVGT